VFGAAVFCCDKVLICSAGTMIFLETQRLLFRSHEAGDEADFVSMHTDAEVRQYVGGQAWPEEKARSRFREQYLGKPTETYGLWATVFKEEGKYVGCCGLRAPGKGVGASLGYYLARPYWGRGLASEASRAFIEVAFTRLALEWVEADAEERNAASEQVLRKCGFEYVRREVIPGSGRIINFYELAKGEWQRGRGA
jgi:[ribosomal protein S5]-alanine N-acetyltransferase